MANLKLPELDTKSVLDIVVENFKRADLKTYAIRMIYIGEHTLCKEEIIKYFRKSIDMVRAGYCEIPINGILLVYDSYFVHILEGSEDTIHRHLRFIFKLELEWIEDMKRLDVEAHAAAIRAAEEYAAENPNAPRPELPEEPPEQPDRKMFRRLKMLMVYHSITTLQFDDWRALTARPPSLVAKLNIYGPLSEHMEQLRICLDKMRKLCDLAKFDYELSFEGVSANDPKMEALPEVALLDFLLASPHILDLRQVLFMHRRVDDYIFYFEHVWPLATHFTPRHLYKLKIDDSFVEPLPVMPWEVQQKDEDEERDDVQRSASSESD